MSLTHWFSHQHKPQNPRFSSTRTKERKLNPETQAIAHTIYIQLGGAGFSSMIGMIQPVLVKDDEEKAEVRATFRWRAKAKDGLNFLEVTLVMSGDYYRVQFGRIGKQEVTRQPIHEEVYADELNPLFEQITGLITIPPVVSCRIQ